MIPVLKAGYDNVKRGMPMKDERTERVKAKAGAAAFYVNIYIMLTIGMWAEKWGLEAHSAMSLAILSGAVIFLVAHILYSRSPKI